MPEAAEPKLAGSALKQMPDFASESAERAFWESHDSSEYIDWPRAQTVQ